MTRQEERIIERLTRDENAARSAHLIAKRRAEAQKVAEGARLAVEGFAVASTDKEAALRALGAAVRAEMVKAVGEVHTAAFFASGAYLAAIPVKGPRHHRRAQAEALSRERAA